MKSLIALIVSFILLLLVIIEALDYFSLNMELIQDVQPAFKGDYTNATENVAETLKDYTIDYAYSLLIIAIIGPIVSVVLGVLGIKRK